MNKAAAFLARDFQIQRSYRLSGLLEVGSVLLTIVPYYFLSRFVGGALADQVRQYGGDYFSFVLVGVVLQEYLLVPLYLFSRHIRESQLNGTLEAVLSTQTPLHTVVLSSALYPLLWSTLHVVIYIGFAMAVFQLRLATVNWIAAALILFFAILVSGGIGILSASFILVFKRGDPFAWLITVMSSVFAGILYPVSILPRWLRTFSDLLPLRYAIDGMRGAVLQNASWQELWPSLGPLIIFAALILPLSLVTFHHVNHWVRMTGTMSEY